MKRKSRWVLGLALVSSQAIAWSEQTNVQNEYSARAKVIDVEPLIEVVNVPYTTEHCWNEQVYHQRTNGSLAGTLVGGLLGGVLGNQVGKGHGRDIATVAGTLLGATVGNNLSDQGRAGYTNEEQRCAVEEHWEEREEVVGYQVKYLYHGRVHYTTMTEYPGDELNVRVSVTPL